MSITNVSSNPVIPYQNAIAAEPESQTQGTASSSSTSSPPSRTAEAQTPTTKPLAQLLTDQHYVADVAKALRALEGVASDPLYGKSRLPYSLSQTMLAPRLGSSYTSSEPLSKVITSLGFKPPKNLKELQALATKLEQKSSLHPLGNFGGGKSWPIPMSRNDEVRLASFLFSQTTGLPGLPLPPDGKRTLGYLLSGSSVMPSDLQDPPRALEKLLASPKALALGQALQTFLQGANSDTSAYEYVLSAIHIGLDPDSTVLHRRNRVDEVDLMQPTFWGRSPSTVVDDLTRNLIAHGRVTAETAKLGAYLLLAIEAPQLLIKDVPSSVTIGSVAWTQLVIAAARIEAQTPGRVPGMTYAEVMVEAEDLPEAPAQAQTEALIDWGVANKFLGTKADTLYTPSELENTRAAFNSQQKKLKEASELIDTPIPNRKQMAMDWLNKQFPNVVAEGFERKVIELEERPLPLMRPIKMIPYSLLEITMEGIRMGPGRKATYNFNDPIAVAFVQLTTTPEFNIPSEFDSAYDTAVANVKSVKETVFMNAMDNLPPDDQAKLLNGEIRYFQEKSYKVGVLSNTLFHTSPKVLITARNGSDITTYECDTEQGSLTRQRTNAKVEREPEYLSNEVSYIEEFFPDTARVETNNTLSTVGNIFPPIKLFAWATSDSRRSSLDAEQSVDQSQSNMFTSVRASHIAKSLVSTLDLDNPAYKKQASETTAAEYREEQRKAGGQFVLNLIPFRSAIINFRDGKFADGLQDLQLDILGFVTAGFGAGAKAANAVIRVNSALGKVAKVSKIFGAAALGELNPLSGVGSLVVGVAKLAYKGVGKGARLVASGVDKLKGATGDNKLLKAVSKDYKAAAVGTFKVADQRIEGGAVFIDGKWYGFDAARKRPFGPALTDFKPNVVTHEGEVRSFADTWLGKMIGFNTSPQANNPYFLRDYSTAVTTAKAQDATAYWKGYNSGSPNAIQGYSTALNVNDLKRLAISEVRSAAELGSLGKRMDQLDTLPIEFKSALQTAEAVDPDAFVLGYKAGKPTGISGYSDTLNTQQLGELIVANKKNPEAVGHLLKELERKRIVISVENYRVFKDEIVTAGGQAVPLQQGFYLSQVSQLSEGECAAMSHLMAAAQKEGKQDTFMLNLHAAMVTPLPPKELQALQLTDPAKALLEQARARRVTKFREELNTLQLSLENNFHLGNQSRQVPYTTIISELANARSSKTLLIQGPGHGITAGVKVSRNASGNEIKTWFYFDPNYGQATFTSEASMKAALESTLNSGYSKQGLPDYAPNTATPEFKISNFDPVELNIITRPTGIDPATLYRNDL